MNVSVSRGRIFVPVQFRLQSLARGIPGAKYHPGAGGVWSFPRSQEPAVRACFPWAAEQLDILAHNSTPNQPSPEPDTISGSGAPVCKAQTVGGEHTIHTPPPGPGVPHTHPGILPHYEFKLPPFPHQQKMLEMCYQRPKFALFCEMGTGKTKVIVDLVGILNKRTIIFCPKSVIGSWEREVGKNSDSLKVRIATGSRGKKEEALTDPNADIVVTNYETILAFDKEPWWRYFKIAVCDESSRIKNHKARTTKAMLKVFKDTPRKYILSGTPITQNPMDIWSQMEFLSPSILGFRSWYSMRAYHCIMGGYMNKEIVKYVRMDELKGKLSRASVQLKKEDVLPDLPEKLYQIRDVDMPVEVKRQYKQMKEDFIVELENEETITVQSVLTKMLRLQEIIGGSYLATQAGNEKLNALEDIVVEAISQGRQVVVWAKFLKHIAIIHDRLGKLCNCSVVTGATTDRQAEIESFQSGKTKVFIGQERTGGLGITLTAGDIMVYYENTFSLEDRKQSEDRIHRIGQKNNCLYIDLCYKGTIDTHVLRAIQKKQDIAHFLVDSFLEGKYKVSQRRSA